MGVSGTAQPTIQRRTTQAWILLGGLLAHGRTFVRSNEKNSVKLCVFRPRIMCTTVLGRELIVWFLGAFPDTQCYFMPPSVFPSLLSEEAPLTHFLYQITWTPLSPSLLLPHTPYPSNGPFLLSRFQQLLQARYSHLKIWSQGPPVRENMGRLSFFLGLSNLNTSFPSAPIYLRSSSLRLLCLGIAFLYVYAPQHFLYPPTTWGTFILSPLPSYCE